MSDRKLDSSFGGVAKFPVEKIPIEFQSDQEVLNTIRKLKQLCFGEKNIGRYLQKIKQEGVATESTLVHVATGAKLGKYFKRDLSKQDQDNFLEYTLAWEWHDAHEPISNKGTGLDEILGSEAKENSVKTEREDVQELGKMLGDLDMNDIGEKVLSWFDQKENKSTKFGRWLEALDRIQPLFWFFEDPDAVSMVKTVNTVKQRFENWEKVMSTMSEFPNMHRLAGQIYQHLAGAGFFDEDDQLEFQFKS